MKHFLFAWNLLKLRPLGYFPTKAVQAACPAEQPFPQASRTAAGNLDGAEEMRLSFVGFTESCLERCYNL